MVMTLTYSVKESNLHEIVLQFVYELLYLNYNCTL